MCESVRGVVCAVVGSWDPPLRRWCCWDQSWDRGCVLMIVSQIAQKKEKLVWRPLTLINGGGGPGTVGVF